MIIKNLKVNHIKNPLGFAMERPVFSYVVTESTGKYQKKARLQIALDVDMENIVYDSGFSEETDSLAYPLPENVRLAPATRYYWQVTVMADDSDCGTSETAWFETAKDPAELTAAFITSQKAMNVTVFYKRINVSSNIKKARAYATALGIYELTVNQNRAGREYLTPYASDYDSWLQFQTFDVTDLLQSGENELAMTVAPGWYSGYFGFEGKNHIYGDKTAAFLQLEIEYADGRQQMIRTDGTWRAKESQIRYSEIYHGEIFDRTFVPEEICAVAVCDYDRRRLSPRRSLPVIIKEMLSPERILHTPAGETVIDMGQNMVGWLSFRDKLEKGARLYFQFGEILQDGNFYRDNLRTAKAEFTYISDGSGKMVRPHFTFFGFRYAKVEGLPDTMTAEDFTGEVIYSDMDITGYIQTANPLVNRLARNALWGQKGNFVDVPTDCPQRDERMGWTGDAEVFCGAAAFNMDVFAFYSKYGYDMLQEQKKYDGCVPMVIPSFHMGPGGSAAWADAATVIPWTTYLYSGDKAILQQQYPSMKMWTDYIYKQDMADGGRGLWQTGFHFGDWLALDNTDPSFPTGATEPYYVASAYYYLSASLTAKAAGVLEKDEDAGFYGRLAEKIKKALQAEYFTSSGRMAIPTQTGYILALAFGFCPEAAKARVAADLNTKIIKDGKTLMTGFVGTPYICKVLSEYGYNEMAYHLLLNEDYPGWLYQVRMGATTIWERWNSVLPDGKINPEGMNSLNHYAYGAVAEWMFRYIGGINPVEKSPGFRRIDLKPMPDERMPAARCIYDSPVGTYESSWKIEKDELKFRFVIPFGAKAAVTLPDVPAQVMINGVISESKGLELCCGIYEISYKPVKSVTNL